jgi:hypothetical protein
VGLELTPSWSEVNKENVDVISRAIWNKSEVQVSGGESDVVPQRECESSWKNSVETPSSSPNLSDSSSSFSTYLGLRASNCASKLEQRSHPSPSSFSRCSGDFEKMAKDHIRQGNASAYTETRRVCLTKRRCQTPIEPLLFVQSSANATEHKGNEEDENAKSSTVGCSISMILRALKTSADNSGNPICLNDDDDTDDDSLQDSSSFVSIGSVLGLDGCIDSAQIDHIFASRTQTKKRKRGIAKVESCNIFEIPIEQLRCPKLQFDCLEKHWTAVEASLPKLKGISYSLRISLAKFYADFYALGATFDKSHRIDSTKVSQAICGWNEVSVKLGRRGTLAYNVVDYDNSEDSGEEESSQQGTFIQVWHHMERFLKIAAMCENTRVCRDSIARNDGHRDEKLGLAHTCGTDKHRQKI